jgi:hypothetical protein
MNFVMRDRETGSAWQQATGEAFDGPLKGKRLTIVPFEITTWGEWRARHPETLALLPESRFEEQYRLMAQRVASLRGSIRPRDATLRDDPRLPPMTQVLGIEIGGGRKAYSLPVVEKHAIVNDQVGSAPVLLVYAASSETTTAFSRVLGGWTLTFRAAKSGGANIVDMETGSTWTPYGECTDGMLKGSRLEPITPLPSFWFSWAQFFPDTEVYK